MTARSMPRGDTLAFVVQVTNPLYEGDVPLDVTGWKFYFTVKRWVSEPDQYAVHQDSTTSGSGLVAIVTPATLGKVSVAMPAAKTILFPDTPTTLVYDVEGIDVAGNVRTVDSGTIKVSPDVTRAVT